MKSDGIPAGTRYRIAWLGSALLVGLLYYWVIGIGAPSQRFAWDSGLKQFYGLGTDRPENNSGDAVYEYYGLLGRAFAAGKVSLPVKPRAELAALKNPWDDRVNRPYRLLDAVFYQQKFYLYHGPVPALVLFTPWYLLSGHDLPENFAAFLICFGAYLILCELFLLAISCLPNRVPLPLLALLLLTLGIAQSVPFLLHRAKVYEVAIGAGFLFVAGGFYCLFRRLLISRAGAPWLLLSGFCFGLAIGCRPHLGLAAASVLLLPVLMPAFKVRLDTRSLVLFSAPICLCCLGLAAYNYARFSDPLEFGLRYQMGDATYRNFKLSPVNLLPGFYYLLLCPPDLVPEFPFFRLAFRPPFDSSWGRLPRRYFLELTGGLFSLCPLALFAPFALAAGKRWRGPPAVAALTRMVMVFAAGCIVFIAATGLMSQRFEVDFQPFLVLLACIAGSELVTSRKGGTCTAAMAVIASLALYGIFANLTLAVQGPYDQFVQSRPAEYVRLASWFSPVERFRPLLNPAVRIRGFFEFAQSCPPRREPLVSLGEFGSRYLLSAECAPDRRIRLISESSAWYPGIRSTELPFPSPGRNLVGLSFDPHTRIMTVTWNGTPVMQDLLRFLVTSPSQIRFGRDPTFGNENRFDWPIIAWPPRIWQLSPSK